MSFRWIPNAICLVRIALVVPIVLALFDGNYRLALALIVIAGGSDGLDGFLAKTYNWQTRLGGFLDPFADKLLITSVFISLSAVGLVPIGLTVIVVARDIVIVAGALTYQMLIKPVTAHPTVISKLNTACQLGFMVFVLTNAAFAWPPEISLLVLGATVVFTSIVSGLNYVLHWSSLALQHRRSADPADLTGA